MAVKVCIMVLDNMVICNYYTYMMHINYMDYSQEEMKSRFLETMKQFKFHKYIATEERGTQNKLLHLQCCLWHQDSSLDTTKIKDYRFSKQRRYKTGKNAKKKTTQISLSPASKDTLASYSLKDIHMKKTQFCIHNLTKNEMKLIPKWVDYKDENKQFNIALHKYCTQIGKQGNPDYNHNVIEFYCQILDFYKLHKRKSFPTRKRSYDFALMYHDNYDNYSYLKDIGVIREYDNDSYTPNSFNNI